jgi:hypothetical protein
MHGRILKKEAEQSENVFMQKETSLDFENLSQKSTGSFKAVAPPINISEIYEFEPAKGPEQFLPIIGQNSLERIFKLTLLYYPSYEHNYLHQNQFLLKMMS